MFKNDFLSVNFVQQVKKLKGDEAPNWGVLSAQGMIEHMTESVAIAYGKIKQPLTTAPELLEKMKAFAMSDKEFKPNTKNVLMSESPAPLVFSNITDAISDFEKEINAFHNYYKTNTGAIITNPFFGDLNYEEWQHLLNKHALHHLKQYNLA